METGHDGSQGNAAGALNIVVETRNIGPILVENAPRYVSSQVSKQNIAENNEKGQGGTAEGEGGSTVGQAKVFKVNIGSRVKMPRGLDKAVDKVGVLPTADALVPQAQVQLVVEELLVVGAAVQDDGEGPVGVDAGAERGENELGHGDEDTADALIANAQNLLAV